MVAFSVRTILAAMVLLSFPAQGRGDPANQHAQVNVQQIEREIEDAFAEDILSSRLIHERREYFRANPEAFEAGPVVLFLQHSDPGKTVETILGEDVFQAIPAPERLKLVEALRNTFRRYAHEWLQSNLNTDLRLKEIKVMDRNLAVLVIERSMKIAPDLDLKLFVHKGENGWKVFDFGFWNFKYTRMKRGVYVRNIKKAGISGLTAFLVRKNDDFFAQSPPQSK